MTYGLNISGGNYYGSGSTSSGTYGRTRSASSANFNTMSRNIASGYSSDMEIIQKYLEDGKTDKAIEMYESLFDDVKETTSNYNYELTDSEIKSILKNAYQSSTGYSILDSIEDNTSSSFWTGFKQSIPIFGLFCNDTSEAEAVAKLSGQEVSTKDKVAKFAGMAAGTALFWLAGGWVGKVAKAVTATTAAATTANNVGLFTKSAETVAGLVKDLNNGSKIAKGAQTVATGAAALSTVSTGVNALEETAEIA